LSSVHRALHHLYSSNNVSCI